MKLILFADKRNDKIQINFSLRKNGLHMQIVQKHRTPFNLSSIFFSSANSLLDKSQTIHVQFLFSVESNKNKLIAIRSEKSQAYFRLAYAKATNHSKSVIKT